MIKHIRWTAILIAALVLAALPVHSEVASTRVSSLQGRVDALQATIDLAARRHEITRTAFMQKQAQVDAGAAPASELAPLQEQLLVLEAELKQIEPQLRDAKRLVKLASPVDVELKDASLRQVAEALTKATGLQITVDGGIKDDPQRNFTLTVRGAPLAQILEQIADSAKVLIAPEEEGGVVLVPEAYSSVNGQSIASVSRNAPWSNDWAMAVGGYPTPVGQRWLRLIEAVNTAWTFADLGLLRRPGQTTAPAAPVWAAGGTPQPVITSMSPNTFIVGEPGTNDKGEPGMWLTFYSIDSGKMIPGIKYFHRFTPPAAPNCWDSGNHDL